MTDADNGASQRLEDGTVTPPLGEVQHPQSDSVISEENGLPHEKTDYKSLNDNMGKTGPRTPSWLKSNRMVIIALSLAGIWAFGSTAFLMSPAVETTERNILISLFVGNFMIAAGFAILVGARLWHVWSNRRNELAGSRMHMQLVRLFSLVAVIPAVIAFLLSFTILRTSLNDVFSNRIEDYQQTGRSIANGLVQHFSDEIKAQMIDTAIDIHRNELQNIGFSRTPVNFRNYLEIQARARSFSAVYLIDSERNPVARIKINETGTYNLPEQSVFDRLDREIPNEEFVLAGVSFDRYWFDFNNSNKVDMWRGILKIPDYGGGYLIVYKTVDPALAQNMRQVRLMAEDWSEAIQGRRRLERVFVAGYVLLGIIIFFGAIWLALGAATQIVSPIGRLVGMADRVSSGDLAARVSVYKNDGEVGELARSMNRMTAQLQTQRSDLVNTNRQFDKRRRFTEAVLSGVTSGVLGVGADGRITIANRSAAGLFGIEANRITGTPLVRLVPEVEPLFEEAITSTDNSVGGQVDFLRNGRTQTFNIQIVRDTAGGERSFVVTIDDITQLISAQRNAAWGDVARRIAHEIKNPLTPIQLSAERLRRKYLSEIQTAPEIFDKCTDTIIRQVNDIGRMVDEFSSFARMPKPVINIEDVRELAKSAIFPQRVTYPDISFETDIEQAPVCINCDGRLIVQALTNLIKNAAESISSRLSQENTSEDGQNGDNGKILVRVKEDASENVVIEIIDNGIGLPKAERHRMAEPYMTTREKGTGLGLAIVKKVAEEHHGTLTFEDDTSLGNTGARLTITLPLAGKSELSLAKYQHKTELPQNEVDGAMRAAQ